MIKSLTSLRFLFALLVFFHHLTFIIGDKNKPFRIFYDKYLEEGYIGVGFFFILSGFILAYVYENKLQSGLSNLKKFYVYRLARIYPLHFLTILLSIPLTLTLLFESPFGWLARLIEQVFLIQSFNPIRSHYFSFNFVSWSISCELFFYLMFPFLLKKIKNMNILNICILIICLFTCIISLMFFIEEKYQHAFFYINPFTRMFDFSIGISLFFLSKNLSFGTKSKATLIELFSIIFLLIFYLNSYNIPQVFRLSVYYWAPISFIIVVFSKQSGKISSFLSSNILIILGEISYGFYLYHILIIKFAVNINEKFHIINNEIWLSIYVFIISLIVSYISYHIFEKKANLLIKKWFLQKI